MRLYYPQITIVNTLVYILPVFLASFFNAYDFFFLFSIPVLILGNPVPTSFFSTPDCVITHTEN